MPVIRGHARVQPPEKREALLAQLRSELGNQRTEHGPVVFEVPIGRSEKFDVVVVWERWGDFSSEERSDIIVSAYQDRAGAISLAMGVTPQEAVDLHVLPYAVVPMIRAGELDAQVVRQAMLEAGGIEFPDQKIQLRFPTLAMAETAHRDLCQRLPNGYWSVVQEAASII